MMLSRLPPSLANIQMDSVGAGTGKKTTEKVVALSSDHATPRAVEQFEALWSFIEGDLPHTLGAPTLEKIEPGQTTILLGLRGREVCGLLWAERLEAEKIELWEATKASNEAGSLPLGASVGLRASLGINLIWVRRSERRRGLARALVDAARARTQILGSTAPTPVEEVAFSETTDQGFAFAASYLADARGGGRVLTFRPKRT
mmetsp:Transcript_95710/g.167127  ORF Transcript_95710/g.167127 Transcript_95710/m.167127 type:complete len:203 (-) Transcript_95710:38-646(-)